MRRSWNRLISIIWWIDGIWWSCIHGRTDDVTARITAQDSQTSTSVLSEGQVISNHVSFVLYFSYASQTTWAHESLHPSILLSSLASIISYPIFCYSSSPLDTGYHSYTDRCHDSDPQWCHQPKIPNFPPFFSSSCFFCCVFAAHSCELWPVLWTISSQNSMHPHHLSALHLSSK